MENWDDDFQDTDSPGPAARRRNTAATHPLEAPTERPGEVENWDDDFEDGGGGGGGSEGARTAGGASPGRRRTPRKRGSWPSSDEEDDDDGEYGFGDGEDRTVTSRTRGAGMGMHIPFQLPVDHPPMPPLPPMPSPFPRSPTASVFSVPVSSTTGRESVTGYSYSSTAHLALRPTLSGGSAARLALLPPSPPIHRERRRLRKKSRPPPNFEDGIFELDDRAEIVDPPMARPVTPEQKKPSPGADEPSAYDAANTTAPASSGKTPLLSRIGSVGKKWNAGRKKRVSTGPTEVALHEATAQAESGGSSRPTSFIASTSPGSAGGRNWFFRAGGGGHGPQGSPPRREGALKSEKSVERLLHLMRAEQRGREPDTPLSREKKGKERRHARESTAGSSALPQDLDEPMDGSGVPTATLLFGIPRRPTSMQISQSSSGGSGSSWASSHPPVPRHASYGDGRHRRPVTPSSRASSKQRSASASVEDVHHRSKKSSTATRETMDDRSSDAHSSAAHHERPPLPIPPSEPPGDKDKEKEKEKGSRRFMGGMRRISLVGSGKHKRTKSTAAEDVKEPPPEKTSPPRSKLNMETLYDQSTPRPPSRVIRSSQDVLLPPIELQPPSPPRAKRGTKTPPSGATPTRRSLTGGRPTLEPSRSHPTLSPRSSLSQTSSHETSLPTIPSPLPSPTRPKPSTSPVQTASLGRTALPPKERETPINSSVLRRNSLGDLKIPARISQAQVSLRRDLTMVRDFASSVEQLKQLQSTYSALVVQVRELLSDSQESQSRPVSPNFIHLPRPVLRTRSNTNPAANNAPNRNQLNAAFLNIEAKYRLSWECAELLVDLAGGAPNPSASPPPSSSQSAPVVPTSIDGRKSRERAITLAGDEQKPVITPAPHGATSPPLASPPSQWRASTGRHDLSQRQLLLLREMLNNPDPSATMSFEPGIPEEDINRNWRWGDAMNSTVTLPSEESGGHQYGTVPSPTKKRRTSRLGMRGLRDMLKSLKKSYSETGQSPVLPRVPASTSSVSASTDSSLNLNSRPQSVAQRRRAKTSTGPESIASRRDIHPNSPYGTTPSLPHKSSPRRPSLASIFRIGQKSKPSASAAGAGPSVDDLSSNAAGLTSSDSGLASGTSLGDDLEEDWDRVESVSDLDHAARSLGIPISSDGTATVRGKKGKSPYLFHRDLRPETPRRGPDASGSSIWSPGSESPKKLSAIPPSTLQSYQRSIKLSDVRESGEEGGGHSARALSRSKHRQSAPSPSPRRPPSRNRKNPTGSVRSAPPQPWGTPSPDLAPGALPDVKLAMAPENIKPLLENAREVHLRCADCIAELEALLASGVQPPAHAQGQ
ncbi:uncharacterized protein TRAVEDRAFT_156016 [Trametes versicolor FP-101664 SS1]|uniref:uncharacterized protein n=1 Tax=Trametes versicolor (strain FP-101664) TaxID=717944 RepID=UPI0004623028|nr:uncharacterized protein TRAVEDRAFT_156016 [Trametes versicolor FP-101664 SS1]EIW52243.1 hypothetical protein TRAVEDRAFT_156016 [Trametes versicolor FP-101664 SS1]